METSRSKLRREVREKRLAYFQNADTSPQPTPPGVRATTQASSRYTAPQSSPQDRVKRPSHHNSTRDRREQISYDQGLPLSRPLTGRGKQRVGAQHPQSSARGQASGFSPLKRSKNRPASAYPLRTTNNVLADSDYRGNSQSQRPSSAKVGDRSRRPTTGDRTGTGKTGVQRPVSSNVYHGRKEAIGAAHTAYRRRSEFEDFRKGTGWQTETSKRSDEELEDFFQARELRAVQDRDDGYRHKNQQSRLKHGYMGPGGDSSRPVGAYEKRYMGTSVADGHVQDLTTDDPYGVRSRTALEEGIARRVNAQWTPTADPEALQASEFHSMYSAENMLQSLLGIRKAKAKIHDELLKTILVHGSAKAFLLQKSQAHKRETALGKGVQDLDGNETTVESYVRSKDMSVSSMTAEVTTVRKKSSDVMYLRKDTDLRDPTLVPQSSEENILDGVIEGSKAGRHDVEERPSSKDDGEESGVEMDDLQFDVGALCSAAKQGDDVLRQYIKGLTERVKASKKESRIAEPANRNETEVTQRQSLFFHKQPQRKFTTTLGNSLSEGALSSKHDPTSHVHRKGEEVANQSASFVEESGMETHMQAAIGKESNDRDTILAVEPVSQRNMNLGSILDSDNEHKELQSRVVEDDNLSEPDLLEVYKRDTTGKDTMSAASVAGSLDKDKPQEEEEESKEIHEYDFLQSGEVDVFGAEEKSNRNLDFENDPESIVSRVKEPAVTADILERLGLFDVMAPSENAINVHKEEELADQGASKSRDDSMSSNDAHLLSSELNNSDLSLETFRPENRTFTPLQDVGNYNRAGVLTTSTVETADSIEEVLERPSSGAETSALRRTYDMEEGGCAGEFADPDMSTPFHSKIQQSKNGVSFVFDPLTARSDFAQPGRSTNVLDKSDKVDSYNKSIAFEVELTARNQPRKQPKPPPSSKPTNSRMVNPNRSSPKKCPASPRRARPKTPRTQEAHLEEVRQHHEKERRTRRSSSPRKAEDSRVATSSEGQPSLKLSLPADEDTSRQPNQLQDSLSDLQFGAPFAHSPRRAAPLEDENEVLDRIASFDPLSSNQSSLELEGDSERDVLSALPARQAAGSGTESLGLGASDGYSDGHQRADRPRPSSANPKRTSSKKLGGSQKSRPSSAHSKMYSSPDKSYDRKWPQSSMAWMTQQKLASSLVGGGGGGDEPISSLPAAGSGAKVRSSQSRVNREFARREKPPVAVQTARRDREFIRVRSSKIMDGVVARVLEGRGSSGVPPLTLQLIQDSPRGSESLSIWQLLPDEILLHIFSYLSQPGLIPCALTCQRFHRIAMDDSLWRTIILEGRDLTDFYLTHIGERQPVSLSLVKCRGKLVTENGLRNLFRSCADSLQELNITGCSQGELQGDSILLHVSRCYNLTSLDASWCAVTDNGLSAILDGCPRLESICLNGCQALSDQCLRQIVNKYASNLRVLEVCGCFNLSPQTLTHLAETSNQLINLNIAQCYKITDDCVSSVAPSFHSLLHWNLKGCRELRDSSVRKIARHCKRLQTLCLASCPHITDVSLVEIATYLNSIRSLDVSGCRKVGNEGMRCLATCCPFLKRIGLTSTSVTHKTVSSLASYTSQTLEEVKLNCCREITEASIIRLLKHCKKLKTLHLYGVKGLRNLGILKVQYPCIEYLEKTRPV